MGIHLAGVYDVAMHDTGVLSVGVHSVNVKKVGVTVMGIRKQYFSSEGKNNHDILKKKHFFALYFAESF